MFNNTSFDSSGTNDKKNSICRHEFNYNKVPKILLHKNNYFHLTTNEFNDLFLGSSKENFRSEQRTT